MKNKFFIFLIFLNIILIVLIINSFKKENDKKIINNVSTTILTTTHKIENKSLGIYKCTSYCPCTKCSGKYGNMTSTGVKAKEGRTVAVDPKVIPYGTHLLINNHEYIAEDCGGLVKGKHIDIYYNNHKKAVNIGTRYLEVKIKMEK